MLNLLQLRSDIVQALSDATSGMTSIDNLQQMTSAMSVITAKTDEVNENAQVQFFNHNMYLICSKIISPVSKNARLKRGACKMPRSVANKNFY